MASHRSLCIVPLMLAFATMACGSSPPPSRSPTPSAAIQRLKKTYSCARGVEGEGKIDTMSTQGRLRGDIMVLAVNPSRIRLYVYSSFGVNLATLTSDGTQFALFDMKNKVFTEGPALPCNIAKLTQVPMPAHALVKLLRGQVPLLVHNPAQATLEWDSGGYYVLTIPSKNEAVQVIHFAPREDDFKRPYNQQRVEVLSMEVSQRGFVHYRVEMKDHAPTQTSPPRVDPMGLDPDVPPCGPACQISIPRSIRVEVPYTKQDLLFHYKQVGLNPPLIENVFTQPVPGGVRRQHTTCRSSTR